MLWLLIALFVTIIILEVPLLLKQRWYRELAVFGVLFIASVYLGLAQLYNWPVYNPFSTLIKILGH